MGTAQGKPKGSKDPDGSRDGSRVSQINTTRGRAGSSIPRAQPLPRLEKATAEAATAAGGEVGRAHLTLGRQQVGIRISPLYFLILTRKEDFWSWWERRDSLNQQFAVSTEEACSARYR